MTTPQRVSAAAPLVDQVELEDLVPVFHGWIRDSAVDDMLIDVARYAHVHMGPGVMAIGHEGDYSVEAREGRSWLRYTLKRAQVDDAHDAVAVVLRRLAAAAGLLTDTSPVDLSQLEVSLVDRLHATDPDEAVALVVQAAATALGSAANARVVADGDPREGLRIALSQG